MFSGSDCEKAIKKNEDKAKKLLENEKDMNSFLNKLEKKLNLIPVVGKQLSDIPIMAEMVKSYWNKEYTEVPVGTIVSVLAALIYFVSPVDLIPDFLPVVGFIDDALIASICFRMVGADIDKYKRWKKGIGNTETSVKIDFEDEEMEYDI